MIERDNEILRDLRSLGAVGILTAADLDDMRHSTRRVLRLLESGGWHRAEAIDCAAGDGSPARGGLRRMRELRRWGYAIERRKVPGSKRVFEYALRPRADQ